VFENRVLRKIVEPKRVKVRGEWRRLHSEEHNHLYCSPNNIRVIKSRRIRGPEHVACIEDRRGAYRILVGKREGNRQFGRP
jgi:hypothetical protein